MKLKGIMIIVVFFSCTCRPLMQRQGRILTLVITVPEGPEMRSGGKIQKPWQRTQTVTSPNNLQTRKLLCQAELKGKRRRSADGKFRKDS